MPHAFEFCNLCNLFPKIINSFLGRLKHEKMLVWAGSGQGFWTLSLGVLPFCRILIIG